MTSTQRRVAGLLMIATWLTLDMIRFSGPLISQLFDIGVEIAAGSAIAVFVGGAALASFATIVARRTGPGIVVLATAAAIIVLRLLLPFLSEDALVLYGLMTLALTLCLLVFATRSTVAVGGGGTAVGAFAVGAMIAVIEQTVLSTWDAIWRPGLSGAIPALLLCAALAFTALRSFKGHSEVPTRGLWALGLWLSVTVFTFANLAFVSSQTGYPLGVSVLLAVFGLATGAVAASRAPNMPQPAVIAVAAIATLGVWTLMSFQGPVLIVMAPVAIAATTYAVSRTLSVAKGRTRSGARFLGASATFGLFALLPFMLVQLDYDMPLGIPHLLVITISVAAIGGGAIVSALRKERLREMAPGATGFRRRAGVLSVASVLVAAFSFLTLSGGGSDGAAPEELRVVNWNLHYGVTPGATGGPDLDLKEMAADIASHDPDVVLLQEVARGWILGGGADMLQYLADELTMDYVYYGAHDHQFGNAILSRHPLINVETHDLPYGEGPQRRSAIVATVETTGGPIQFTSIHLQHKDDDATRTIQAQAFLDAVSAAPTAVVGGDFNDTPDSDVVGLMLERFASAQDDTIGDANTYVGPGVENRIDYVFYDGVVISDFDIGDSPLSDHLSLVFTVRVK